VIEVLEYENRAKLEETMSGPPGRCPPTDEGPEKSRREAGPEEPDAECTAALRPLRSETLHALASLADEASLTDAGADHGDLQLGFLAPSARPGSLGRFGHYEVIDRIGEGGMGLVLKARDERLDRIVALKFLKPALAGSALARRRFKREAQAAAAVCHENVVTIHAVDETSGQPYLVMQFVSGHSLQEKIDSKSPLALKDIVRIGKEVAAGLAAAHAQGLVHRDIKPANILLENSAERVKITDFGLARAIDDASVTQSGVVVGTPSHMSPEQACGKAVDHRTDLFSLGSVLYAMCTGRSPFQSDSTVGVLRKVSDEEPQPIRELNPQIPDWLVAIVSRLMAKDPALRYQSAAEVADVLARYRFELERPPEAQRLSPSEPARSQWSRRRMGAPLLAAAILFSVGLPVWWAIHSGNPGQYSATVAAQASERIESPTPSPQSPAMPPPSPEPPPAPETAPILTMKPDLDAARKAQDQATAGTLSLRNGEFHKAIDQFTEAIRIDPKLVQAYSHRGAADNRLGEWNHAIVDFNEYLKRAPDTPWGLHHRSIAYFALGDIEHALADSSRSITVEPNTNHGETPLFANACRRIGCDATPCLDCNLQRNLRPLTVRGDPTM
jgi:serine/threonine protein kinase